MAKKTTENDYPVQLPSIAKRTVIRKVPSGEIAIEEGAEGVYLRYDCDCEDAYRIAKHAVAVCRGSELRRRNYRYSIRLLVNPLRHVLPASLCMSWTKMATTL